MHLSFTEHHARQAGLSAAIESICREADRLARCDVAVAMRQSAISVGTINRLCGAKAGR